MIRCICCPHIPFRALACCAITEICFAFAAVLKQVLSYRAHTRHSVAVKCVAIEPVLHLANSSTPPFFHKDKSTGTLGTMHDCLLPCNISDDRPTIPVQKTTHVLTCEEQHLINGLGQRQSKSPPWQRLHRPRPHWDGFCMSSLRLCMSWRLSQANASP